MFLTLSLMHSQKSVQHPDPKFVNTTQNTFYKCLFTASGWALNCNSPAVIKKDRQLCSFPLLSSLPVLPPYLTPSESCFILYNRDPFILKLLLYAPLLVYQVGLSSPSSIYYYKPGFSLVLNPVKSSDLSFPAGQIFFSHCQI